MKLTTFYRKYSTLISWIQNHKNISPDNFATGEFDGKEFNLDISDALLKRLEHNGIQMMKDGTLSLNSLLRLWILKI